MRRRYDLGVTLHFGNHPVRVGVLNDEVVFALNDLLSITTKRSKPNVTFATSKVPDDLIYRATAVDAGNGLVTAVTKIGATIAICRQSKADMDKVVRLIKWMDTVDKEKIKGA